MEQKITWREGRDLLLQAVEGPGAVTCPLEAGMLLRLAQPVFAREDSPAFDRSPFDGYAFRSGDTCGALPVTLSILEELPAGSVPTCTVTPGTAVKILTGAPIPPGADAVTKFEETSFTRETVTLHRSYRPGQDLIRQGEDVTAGSLLAPAGTVLDGGCVGALAAQGIRQVSVHPRLRVGVISTGSELAPLGQEPLPGQIRNSSTPALLATLLELGCIPKAYPAPVDEVNAIAAVLARAVEENDLVITTGGVSVGDYDLTEAAYRALDAELLCGDLRLKPGGKCCMALLGHRPLLGLSGNPASAMTCFYALVLPLIRKMQGHPHPCLPELTARLGVDFPKKSPQPRLLRGRVGLEQGELTFLPGDKQGNSALLSLSGANALMDIPQRTPPLAAGTAVTVIYLDR